MTPALTFFIGLVMLVLFGWYFATDQGLRKRLLALTLTVLLVVFSIVTIWPPEKKIALGLDIQGGTSFLIRLKGGDKEVNKGMLDQAVEVIRKRVDYFGASEPIIVPNRTDNWFARAKVIDPFANDFDGLVEHALVHFFVAALQPNEKGGAALNIEAECNLFLRRPDRHDAEDDEQDG